MEASDSANAPGTASGEISTDSPIGYDASGLFGVLVASRDPEAAGIDQTSIRPGYAPEESDVAESRTERRSSTAELLLRAILPRKSASSVALASGPQTAVPPAASSGSAPPTSPTPVAPSTAASPSTTADSASKTPSAPPLASPLDAPSAASPAPATPAPSGAAAAAPTTDDLASLPPPNGLAVPGLPPPPAELLQPRASRMFDTTPIAQLARHRRVLVIGASPGVGTTMVTYCIADVMAAVWRHRTVALELVPSDAGLSRLLPPATETGLTELVEKVNTSRTAIDLNDFTTRTRHGMVTISSTGESIAVGADDFGLVSDFLAHHYNVSVVDGGAGTITAALPVAARLASQVLVVGSVPRGLGTMPLVLDWLTGIGRSDLAQSAIAVVNQTPGKGIYDETIQRRFSTIATIPEDPHIAESQKINVFALASSTRLVIRRLGEAVTERMS